MRKNQQQTWTSSFSIFNQTYEWINDIFLGPQPRVIFYLVPSLVLYQCDGIKYQMRLLQQQQFFPSLSLSLVCAAILFIFSLLYWSLVFYYSEASTVERLSLHVHIRDFVKRKKKKSQLAFSRFSFCNPHADTRLTPSERGIRCDSTLAELEPWVCFDLVQ